MWIFTVLPSWTFHLLFFLAIVVYLITSTVKVLPYANLIRYGSIAVFLLSVYCMGMQFANDSWIKKSRDLQLKVKELEAKSSEENVKIVEKIVVKREASTKKGQELVQYVDRVVVKDNEVIKYIEHCPKLPDEIVTTINKAAKP